MDNNINYKAIHESILGSVLDIVKGVKDIKDASSFVQKGSGYKNFKSISSATKDLILTFPVLVSGDLSIETAQMIAKAQERKCATMIQMLIAAESYTGREGEGVQDWIKNFHTNLPKLDDFNDYLDNYIYGRGVDAAMGSLLNLKESEDGSICDDRTILSEMKEYLIASLESTVLADDINRESLRRFFVENGMNGTIVSEGKDKGWDDMDDDERKDAYEKSRTNYNNLVNGYRASEKEIGGLKDRILPAEFKKANELQPTMMAVNFNVLDSNNVAHQRTAVIGVKCKLYPIEYNDVVSHIVGKVKDSNTLMNFIRATTSEISFAKDFVLGVNQAKIDALSYSSGASNKMWKVLERRSKLAKANRLMRRSNDCTAISTLVVSQNIVDYITKTESVNLMRPNTARLLLEKYNLLSLVVADENLEVANFMYDTGEDNFESIAFSGLERESNDGAYRKVVNLMSKQM